MPLTTLIAIAGYNALEGVVAIGAGLAAGSVALTGFGVDSVIEATSGVLSGGTPAVEGTGLP